jgi:probable HAF family extracellular repeat protein
LNVPGSSASFGFNINDLGQVVGIVFPNGQGPTGFRTAPNAPLNLATDGLGVESTNLAYGINNLGQVVGLQLFFEEGGRVRSFRTKPNQPFDFTTDDLGSLGDIGVGSTSTNTFAWRINDLGQVVGSADNLEGETRAFRTAPNSRINPLTDDLGTLGGSESRANGINNLGQVVGNSTNAIGQLRAFRTAPNSRINPLTDDLGTLGGSQSSAADINNLGQVVGSSTNASEQFRAFLYNNGQMLDLNDLIPTIPGVTLDSAIGINDLGQIVASGSNRAFVLTPIVSTSIPEPDSGLSVLAFVALGTSLLAKRKQKLTTCSYAKHQTLNQHF